MELYCTIEVLLTLKMHFIANILNYKMHVHLDQFILYWMLEKELNLNILQLFFLSIHRVSTGFTSCKYANTICSDFKGYTNDKYRPPSTPLFIVKLVYTGVNIFCFIFVQNIDCGYTLEPPH